MPNVFAYRMKFDLGFAPNPFGDLCTLATCKPRVRKSARPGDYVIGTSSFDEKLGKRVPAGSVLYIMRVTAKIDFDDYWWKHPARRPNMAGNRSEQYGDNIYHRVDGVWQQADSRHSLPDGKPSPDDIRVDTGTTDQVLLSSDFTYWGGNGGPLPPHLAAFGHKALREKRNFLDREVDAFIEWADERIGLGRIGWPSDWQLE